MYLYLTFENWVRLCNFSGKLKLHEFMNCGYSYLANIYNASLMMNFQSAWWYLPLKVTFLENALFLVLIINTQCFYNQTLTCQFFLLIFYVPKLLLHQKNDNINFKAKKGDFCCVLSVLCIAVTRCQKIRFKLHFIGKDTVNCLSKLLIAIKSYHQ